ncbi:MAG: response regulator [Acidobacteriota bacterium]
MRIEIDCPQCGYHEDVDSNTVPAGGATLTCKQCRYRWPYYKPQGMSARSGATLDAAAQGARARQMRAAGAPPNAGGKITCPGCGLRFAVAGENPPRPPARSQKRAVPAAAGPARGAQAAASGTGKRVKTILIVEDVEYFTELARDTLGRTYRTITVSRVSEAIRTIEREPIDLLVLDLTLEGETGLAVLRSIKKEFPVLIMTSCDETEMYGEAWQELKRLGADDVLIKGMNMQENLIMKVSGLLGGK